MQRGEKVEYIANYYGRKNQEFKTLEELKELKDEIFKNILSGKSSTNTISEIADCLIMLQQLIYLYDIEQEVICEIDYKLSRQLKRIGGVLNE